jgi:uncharacterized protein (DUF58 family)
VELIAPPYHREVFSLAGHEQRWFSYTLHARRRGVYPLGPLRAETGDVLGLLPVQAAMTEPDRLIVYPQVLPLGRLRLPTRSPQALLPARAPLFEDPARVVGVRPYRAGDPPRRIHWTASASTGELLVKQFRPAIARETLLCLDMQAEAYALRERTDASELAVVAAASLANHIIKRERLAAGLAADAQDGLQGQPARFFLPPRPEHAHLMLVLETLARVQLSARALPLADVLRRERPRLAWGATLVAITGRETAELLGSLAALRQAGFAVALLVVGSAGPGLEARQRAALLGIPLHHIWRASDLETLA